MVIFASGNTPKDLALDLLQATIVYLNNVNTITLDVMIHLIENLPPTERMAGITIYQQFVNKGMEKGMETIIATIIVKDPTYSDLKITELCGVSEDLVKRVRLSLK
jgi:hypothetical protein